MIGRVFCKLVSLCTWMNCCGDAPTDGPGLESCKADSKASANVEDRSEAAVSYTLTLYPNVMALAKHGAFSSRGFSQVFRQEIAKPHLLIVCRPCLEGIAAQPVYCHYAVQSSAISWLWTALRSYSTSYWTLPVPARAGLRM
jgi:hypothetical protein